jgi:hypothetical protein
MQDWIDGSLYPDQEPPEALTSLANQVDFLARVCAAWDFGVLPDLALIKEIKRPEWREAVDECSLLTSPVYHLLRDWHGLPTQPYLGQRLSYIANDPFLQSV